MYNENQPDPNTKPACGRIHDFLASVELRTMCSSQHERIRRADSFAVQWDTWVNNSVAADR